MGRGYPEAVHRHGLIRMSQTLTQERDGWALVRSYGGDGLDVEPNSQAAEMHSLAGPAFGGGLGRVCPGGIADKDQESRTRDFDTRQVLGVIMRPWGAG